MRKKSATEAPAAKSVLKPKAKDVVVTELTACEVPAGFAYDCALALASTRCKPSTSYADCVAKVAKKVGKPALSVHSAFARLAKTANFSKAHSAKLKKLAKVEGLTKEVVVETLVSLF